MNTMLISQHQVHVSVPSKALFIFSIILRSIDQTVKICKKLCFSFYKSFLSDSFNHGNNWMSYCMGTRSIIMYSKLYVSLYRY